MVTTMETLTGPTVDPVVAEAAGAVMLNGEVAASSEEPAAPAASDGVQRPEKFGMRTTTQHDTDGTPTATVHVDAGSNTVTLTLHQYGFGNRYFGDVSVTTPHNGPNGWVGTAPRVTPTWQ